MWQKIKERSKEPSTWAGIGLLTQGTISVFKLDHGQEIVDAVNAAGAAAQSGNTTTGAALLLFGALAVFMREKK